MAKKRRKSRFIKLIKALIRIETRAWGKSGRVPKRFLILTRLILLVLLVSPFLNIGQNHNIECSLPIEVTDPNIQRTWESVYDWCPLIMKESSDSGFAPELIAAIIWVESRGNKTAYSRSGAVGLMQVMPRDGIASRFMCPNGPCFSDRPTISQLENPEFNVDYGTDLLRTNLNRTGSIREALKAYGPIDVGYTYADLVLEVERKIKES